MIRLRKVIKQVLISGVIILGLVLNIASDYISPWLRGRESRIFAEFIRLCNSYWMVLAILLAIISIFWVYDWVRERKDEFRKIWEFYKPVKRLTPEDFKIQRYKKARISRKSDTMIENLLKNGEYILITGKPKIGKTRASYEAIKKLENFSVIKPRPEEIEIEKIEVPPLSNKNIILFLDDLQRFVGKNVDSVIDRFKKKSKKLIVVATCRTGGELDLVREEILSLHREFLSIELKEVSKEDCERLIEDIRKEDKKFEWKPKQFDGTPGSVTLDLEDMKERYKKAGDSKVILKALKLLKEGNLFLYKETRVKDVCGEILELSTEKLRRYVWEDIINNLKANGFITRNGDIIDIYSAYLDFCVYDYDSSLKDLMKLKNILIRMRDSGSLFYLGNSFYYKKDFIHAKDCYLEALKIYPRYAAAHNCLGYALTKLGEAEEAKGGYDEAERLYEEAIQEYREAIMINPNYAADHNNLGYSLTRLGEIKGEYDEATRLYEEAEKEHRTAIRINPNYSSAHHSLAYALGKLGGDEEAEKEYREAIRLNPESPFTHNLLGHLLANKLGRNEEAEKEYREAIRLKPDYPSARNNLGYLLAKVERWKEAEKEYREAIKASPNYIVAYVNLGHLLAKLDRYEEAEREYRKALDINPNYAEAHNSLGYALVNLNRYGEAEKAYRKAIEIKSGFAEAHRNLGYLLVILGRDGYDEAEKEYRKALQINPDDKDTLICLGILLEKLNRDKEAENCYKKVIGMNPNNIKARTTYGYFLSYRGREKEAIREFDGVIKINPDNAEVRSQLMYLNRQLQHIHANRARALTKSGKFDEAEKAIREALMLNPNNALAHKTLGILKEELGDRAQGEVDKLRLYEEAEKEYRKAFELNPNKYPSAHRHLANTLAKLERYKEAENEYKETKKIADNYPKNNRDLGVFLSKIRREEEAKKELELAIKLFKEQRNEKEAEKVRELLKSL